MGRYVHAIGENVQVARFSAINVRWYSFLTYVLCGGIAALSGIMLTTYEGMARVGSGDGQLIDAFLLPLLGGVVFQKMSVEGTTYAALLISMIINGLFILGASPATVNITKGALLLLVVIASGIKRMRAT